MHYNFQDKVVLITGSSSGIGKAAALYFAGAGAKVVLASRNEAANQALLQEIQSKGGGEAIFVQTDITRKEDAKNMVDQAVQAFGKLDIAINNAGHEGTPGVRTADYDADMWDRTIAINLNGVFYSMHYELQALLNNGGGIIVNISSLAGLRGGGAGAAYHAAKFGVVGLTEAAAWEYAQDNIRINAICPAVIETPMADRAFDESEKRERAIKMHPVRRFGKPEEVVDAIAWLASDASSFTTGAAIPIDGGAAI